MNDRGKEAVGRFQDVGRTLQLEQWEEGGLDGDGRDTRFAWRQGDLAASRKQVAPLLRESLKKSQG
jgi:exopolyphosphatase